MLIVLDYNSHVWHVFEGSSVVSIIINIVHLCVAAEQELADHARQVRSNIAAHPALTPVAARGFA